MRAAVASIVGLLSTIQVASACIVAGELVMEDIFDAQVVVLAEVVGYEQQEGWNATFHVRPSRVIAGTLGDYETEDGVLSVTWDFSTFETPKSVSQDTLIFALRPAEQIKLGEQAAYLTGPDLLTVVRRSCGPAHIYVPDRGLGERIEGLFDGVGDPLAEAQAIRSDVFSGLPRVLDHPFVELKPE